MDRIAAMSLLVAAVDAGSLSEASRRLGAPVATVSRKISDLESHLGTRLLVRSTRRLSLTDAGRSYVEAARRILEDLAEAERAAAGEYRAPRGELIVTAPIVFGRLHVLPLAIAFLAAYPDVDLRLMLTDRVVALGEEDVHLAVRIGALPDSSLRSLGVGSVRLVVCANPAYLDRRGTPATLDDLSGHDCIAFNQLMSPGEWSFADGPELRTVRIRSRLVVTTAESAVDAAIAGAGLARVLSYQVVRPVRDGELKLILEAFEPAPFPVSLVHAGGGLMPLKLRAFLDFVAPRMRDRLRQTGGGS